MSQSQAQCVSSRNARLGLPKAQKRQCIHKSCFSLQGRLIFILTISPGAMPNDGAFQCTGYTTPVLNLPNYRRIFKLSICQSQASAI